MSRSMISSQRRLCDSPPVFEPVPLRAQCYTLAMNPKIGPANLYKYLPPERAQSVLGKLLIRFSQVSVMNDIEEFKPPISGVAPREQVEGALMRRADALYPGLPALIQAQGPEYISKMVDDAENNLPRAIKSIYEMNDKNFGILSLSEDPTSAFMWERYADQGRGFLVEFHPSHSWFEQKITDDDDLRHLRRVAYVADRTPAYLLAITAQDYLYTKETKWEYEKEWRIILNFNGAASKVGKDNTETDVLLFAIPPECILSVTLGYNASLEFVEQVRTVIAANPSLSHVRLRRARLLENGSVGVNAQSSELGGRSPMDDLKDYDIDPKRLTKQVIEPGKGITVRTDEILTCENPGDAAFETVHRVLLRCVNCGSSRWDAEGYKCARCGGSPSVRTEHCHISEDTKAKLLSHTDDLKNFGITIEQSGSLQKVAGAVETFVVVLAVADSLSHDDGVLRRLVVYLRDLAIPEQEILRLRLEEPETILSYYRADKKPEA